MGSLISRIAGLSAVNYGVNILEVTPAAGVTGVSSNVVGAVMDLPWGPDDITLIGSPGQFFETFAPDPFGLFAMQATHPALRALLNKSFPNALKISRVPATSRAKATETFDDTVAAASVVVMALYHGLLGNQINIAWVENADDSSARDAVVTIGSAYSATYLAVATIVSSVLVVTDPGDPYVVFTKDGTSELVPVVAAAAALSSGLDGTAVAGDYTTALTRFAGASVQVNITFVAECPSSLVTAVNAALKSYATTHDKGMVVLCSTPSEDVSTAITTVALSRDDRHQYPYPRVKTVNFFDPDAPEITVDGNAFIASALAFVAPEVSPGGAPGSDFMKGITGLENEGITKVEYKALNTAGIGPFFMSTALGGAIIHRALTTSLTPGLTKVFRRRMTDFITDSIAAFLEFFVEDLLDLDLANQALGPVTAPEIGNIKQFLADLKFNNRIAGWEVDPFSGNTQSNIDAGRWIILIKVKLIPMQEEIVLKAEIGEGVTISEV